MKKPPTMQQRIETMQAEVMRAIEKETLATKAKERAEHTLTLARNEIALLEEKNAVTVEMASRLAQHLNEQIEKVIRLATRKTWHLFGSGLINIVLLWYVFK